MVAESGIEDWLYSDDDIEDAEERSIKDDND